MEKYKKDFIKFIVQSQALVFGDFITKSGRKTPYFINTGNFKTGQQINLLGKFYAHALFNNIGKNFNVLFGPAYKGISLAITTSIAFFNIYKHDVFVCYNRKEAKDHGEGGSIIGYKPQKCDKIVLIDDVITAGTSVREAVNILTSFSNAKIKALIVSVDRMEKSASGKSALEEIKTELGIIPFSIVTIEDIVNYLYNKKINNKVYITKKIKTKIDEYRKEFGI